MIKDILLVGFTLTLVPLGYLIGQFTAYPKEQTGYSIINTGNEEMACGVFIYPGKTYRAKYDSDRKMILIEEIKK